MIRLYTLFSYLKNHSFWLFSIAWLVALVVYTLSVFHGYWIGDSGKISIACLIFCICLIMVPVFVKKIAKKRAIVSGRSFFVLLTISSILLFSGNADVHDFGGQILPATLMTMGVICLAKGFLGRAAGIIFVVFFFLIIKLLCEFWLEIPLNAHILSATFRASKDEVMGYMSMMNIIAVACVAAYVFLISFALKKATKEESRSSFMCTGCILVCACFVVRQVMIPDLCNRPSGLWPVTGVTSFVKDGSEAIAINRKLVGLLSSLPSPADEPTSISTLRGDEGVICILHIGESLRADRMSLNGYAKDTTPWLKEQKGLINFEDCISSAHETIESMITILTDAKYIQENRPNDTYLPTCGSMIDLFAENQFKTSSFWSMGSIYSSNDPTFTNIVLQFTKRVSESKQVPGLPVEQAKEIVKHVQRFKSSNLFILVNNTGSHAPFDSYDETQPAFVPTNKKAFTSNPKYSSQSAEEANNAYDNTVRHTDDYMRTLIEGLRNQPFIYIYIGDHGEYIGEDGIWSRGKVFQNPSLYYTSRACVVPFLIYASPEFEQMHPHFSQALQQLRQHCKMTVAHEHIFHTILGLFGIESPYYDSSLDLTSTKVRPYTGPQPKNNGQPLEQSWH